MSPVHDVVARLRAEFIEMPGMRLKIGQIQRLCGVEGPLCRSALDLLVDEAFLHVSPDGHYARASDGRPFRPKIDRRDQSVRQAPRQAA